VVVVVLVVVVVAVVVVVVAVVVAVAVVAVVVCIPAIHLQIKTFLLVSICELKNFPPYWKVFTSRRMSYVCNGTRACVIG